MNEPYDFYGGPLSNFWPSPIVLPHPFRDELVTYEAIEIYFQALKATDAKDHDYVTSVPKLTNPPRPNCWEAKKRGRSIKLRPDWDDVRYDVMVTGLREKFKHRYLRAVLLSTGDREIREDSPTDFIWGYRNGGQNLLGKALMQVREELRA